MLDPVDEHAVQQPRELNGIAEIDDQGGVGHWRGEPLTKLMRDVLGDIVEATKVDVA